MHYIKAVHFWFINSEFQRCKFSCSNMCNISYRRKGNASQAQFLLTHKVMRRQHLCKCSIGVQGLCRVSLVNNNLFFFHTFGHHDGLQLACLSLCVQSSCQKISFNYNEPFHIKSSHVFQIQYYY